LLYIDFLGDIHDISDRDVLPRVNSYENYDDKKFRERFRLLKRVVLHLLSDVWQYPQYISYCWML